MLERVVGFIVEFSPMWKKFLKWTWRLLRTLILLGLLVFFLPRLISSIYAALRTFSVEDVSPERVAIVFGAGLRRDGTPTVVLRDRVETAAKLYFDGKVEKLLMSGDNRVVDYNEPEAMRQHALSLGVRTKRLCSITPVGVPTILVIAPKPSSA